VWKLTNLKNKFFTLDTSSGLCSTEPVVVVASASLQHNLLNFFERRRTSRLSGLQPASYSLSGPNLGLGKSCLHWSSPWFPAVTRNKFLNYTSKLGKIQSIHNIPMSPATLVSRSRIFLPWRWRRYLPPKHRFTQDLQGATSQKTAFFIVTAVETSNLTFIIIIIDLVELLFSAWCASVANIICRNVDTFNENCFSKLCFIIRSSTASVV
jgi:hypothetical protein